MTNPVVGWLQHQLLAHLPKVLVSQMVKLESTLTTEDRVRVTEDILANRDKVELLRKFMMDMPPYDLLRAGFENDMSRFAAIVRLPLEGLSVRPWSRMAPMMTMCPSPMAKPPPEKSKEHSYTASKKAGICLRLATGLTKFVKYSSTSYVSTPPARERF